MTMKRLAALSVGFSVLGVSAAQAHVGDGAHGAVAGLVHPFTGFDHMALLLVVGLIAAHAGRTGFLRMGMVVLIAWVTGLSLASIGVAVPFVEQGIAGALVVLGTALALGGAVLDRRNIVMILIGVSALLHGQAHGLEATGSVLTFAMGSVVGASLAMGVGATLARVAGLMPKLEINRLAGSAMAALGIVLLATG